MQCMVCGVEVDCPVDLFDKAAIFLPNCTGPETVRAHAYTYVGPLGGASVGVDGPYLDCAYGDSVITMETEFADVPITCVGA